MRAGRDRQFRGGLVVARQTQRFRQPLRAVAGHPGAVELNDDLGDDLVETRNHPL